jgi:hypothetical protein
MYKYRETVPGMTTSKQIHIEFVPSSQNSFLNKLSQTLLHSKKSMPGKRGETKNYYIWIAATFLPTAKLSEYSCQFRVHAYPTDDKNESCFQRLFCMKKKHTGNSTC